MTSNEFKANIRLLGMTQAQIASALHVSARTISTIANYETTPALYSYAIKGLLKERLGDQK